MSKKEFTLDLELVDKLEECVLENRSLAENDPENLLKHEVAQIAHDKLGAKEYCSLVNKILDDKE